MIPLEDKKPSEKELLVVVARSESGVASADLEAAFDGRISRRALQRRLASLVKNGRLIQRGSRRWKRTS